jgi:hypothetical protein
MSITDLNEYRRAREATASPEIPRIHRKDINDHCTLYAVKHERRAVVQAEIDFMLAHLEFGPGGWGEFNRPCRIGGEYVATGLIVRFPDV